MEIILNDKQTSFIKDNYFQLSYQKLRRQLAIKHRLIINTSTLVGKCRQLGLKKEERKKFWSSRETNFLLENYKNRGNLEIAGQLNKNPDKTRTFNAKNLWKKMTLLRIKRTTEEIAAIHKKNNTFQKAQAAGVLARRQPEGNIVIWNTDTGPRKFIKVNGRHTPMARHIFLSNFHIPEGYKVYFRDKNPINCTIENLYLKGTGFVSYNGSKVKTLTNKNLFNPELYFIDAGKDVHRDKIVKFTNPISINP